MVDADATSKKVVKYTTAGAWTGITIVQPGFSSPHGIAIDSADNLFVTDRAANKVLKFNDQGGFLTALVIHLFLIPLATAISKVRMV